LLSLFLIFLHSGCKGALASDRDGFVFACGDYNGRLFVGKRSAEISFSLRENGGRREVSATFKGENISFEIKNENGGPQLIAGGCALPVAEGAIGELISLFECSYACFVGSERRHSSLGLLECMYFENGGERFSIWVNGEDNFIVMAESQSFKLEIDAFRKLPA